jgi:hypothetical protein
MTISGFKIMGDVLNPSVSYIITETRTNSESANIMSVLLISITVLSIYFTCLFIPGDMPKNTAAYQKQQYQAHRQHILGKMPGNKIEGG